MTTGISQKRFSLETLGFSPATETTILAAIVGILGGFGAIFFKRLLFYGQSLFWHTPNMRPDSLLLVPWWLRMAVPVIGGFFVGPLIYFFAREAKGHGVPEVIEAVVEKNSVIRPVVVLVKIFASAISISSGGSVGREGPIVQIGAALASNIGRVFRLRPIQMKTIVGCGVAAGIGATFNAPIAGALFALELIVSDFGLTSFTPIIVASVTSTAIVQHFQGNVIEFTLPTFELVSLWEFFSYLILGLIAGMVGYSFSRSLYIVEDFFNLIKLPEWLKPSLGGLVIGCIALGFPHIMGVGYDTIHVLFEGEITIGIILFLVFLKIFATSVTIGSGGSGGIFAPSLFIGAMLGGAFGTVVHTTFPGMTGASGAYALVGMAAVNGACTLAPLSAIIILIELTNNYGIILPLMFTVVIASFVSRKFSHESIYTRKLARKGIHVHMGEDLNILRAIGVKDIIHHDEPMIKENSSMEELMNLALNKRRNVIFVVDNQGKYMGLITLQNLKHVLSNPEKFMRGKKVQDFVDFSPSLSENQMLDTAITLFGETGFDRLPVIDEQGIFKGSVLIGDLIQQYNMEVANRNIAIELGAVVHTKEQIRSIHLSGNTIVTETPVPSKFFGKTIGEIGLRKNYNLSVFLIKEITNGKETKITTPGSSYVFREGDTMLVGGSKKNINTLIKNS